jgi:FkbM family methyltransferase
MSKVFFQIGTNNGNDNFNQLCRTNNPDMIILVEPNPKHIASIQKLYSSFSNVHIINKAIFYTNDEEVKLYIPAKDGIYGQSSVQPGRTSGNSTYTDGHFSLLPMNDWGEKQNLCSFTAQSITFDAICDSLSITNIQYLQIDTEGFDSEIIKMINFDKYNIECIRYEKWGFDEECFTKHIDSNKSNPQELGKAGMEIVKQKLLKYNYTSRDIKDRDGNDIIATKSH